MFFFFNVVAFPAILRHPRCPYIVVSIANIRIRGRVVQRVGLKRLPQLLHLFCWVVLRQTVKVGLYLVLAATAVGEAEVSCPAGLGALQPRVLIAAGERHVVLGVLAQDGGEDFPRVDTQFFFLGLVYFILFY
ncbi:hypothetical protein AGDE_04936 [Angomonas deanei]|nr:hypothetical protein AGDE_04936 [Angomonas deanei]|eukprot:EPY38993.1 hypothetical protein AGDE_04936 [Angomonas deanei]